MDFVIDGVEHHAEIADEPKNEVQQLRRYYAAAKDRLAEVHDDDAEKFEGEGEIQWSILANSWQLIQWELCYGS